MVVLPSIDPRGAVSCPAASLTCPHSHNRAYVKLLKVDNRTSPITAQIEMDVIQKGGEVKRIKKTVRSGNDLLEIFGGRDVCDGYIIEDT
jgi:type III restriction enzyme